MTALYLCYQSIGDPLTATQVVAYLEGLALDGHRMFLLTFEPHPLSAAQHAHYERQLSDLGIAWTCRTYHKRPTLPATLWDIGAGVWHGWRLSRRASIDLWHARGYVPGVMALVLRRMLGGRFLFDIRGLMAEEYADAGVWPENSWLYRLTKRAERSLVSGCDAIVMLTARGRDWLLARHAEQVRGKPLRVIPCCVDLRALADSLTNPLAAPAGGLRMAYVGKVGGCYLTAEMVAFFEAARQVLPALRWDIWTQSDPAALRRTLAAAGLGASASVGRLAAADVLPYLQSECHVALCLIRPGHSKLASSPTKVGEYLAAGLPVVLNTGIGDLDELVMKNRVGVLLRSFDPAAYRAAAGELAALLADPGLRQRCLAAARRHFDLERVGWPGYRELYDLMGHRAL